MERCVCIHGHFYQPPRENPWLEAVECQDSAYPYHDWNERVTAECYGPNSASRVLHPSGRIVDIMNNYSRISFNFGPTVLGWLEREQPETYGAILEADRLAQQRHAGHGSAIAQVYSHMIMPLASSRDKRTQVAWGIRDFEHRFGRAPEGMWLAETAVDLETLELLVEHGIRFTILAPRQAAAVRAPGSEEWQEVGEEIDPKRPYRCPLPSGREIALFFYDGPIARELAFEGLLHNGEAFADRLMGAFAEEDRPQLVHVATDGETYGHHHRRGEMALTYCLHHLESQQLARITVYGAYLDEHPPDHEVRIHEGSSWSCVHGIERWRADCGCNSGMNPRWHQGWRAPLRDALDWLRDELARSFEDLGGELLSDPWAAREAYVEVLLQRDPHRVESFIARHSRRPLDAEDRSRALRLLEMQRNAQLMFSSCGWFFDEVSGIEGTQILKYAARAIQLAHSAGAPDLERQLTERLAAVPSNLPEHGDGRRIYKKFIRPAQVSMSRMAAHYAISSLFHDYAPVVDLYAHSVKTERVELLQSGKARLAIGEIVLTSTLEWERSKLCYAVLHLGDQNISGNVRERADDDESFDELVSEIRSAFEHGDLPETIRWIDRKFGGGSFSLWHLFRDQQREIMSLLFREAEESVETFFRQAYQEHYQLLQAMAQIDRPLPPAFHSMVEFVVNRDLRRCLESEPVEPLEFEHIKSEIDKWSIEIDREMLGLIGSRQIERLIGRLAQNPLDYRLLDEIARTAELYAQLEVPLSLWRSQNQLYRVGIAEFFLRSRMAERGEGGAARWVEQFKRVSELLEVRFD